MDFSVVRIESREVGWSQAGGRMLQRRWRLRRRASQRGRRARWGGMRGCVGPWMKSARSVWAVKEQREIM
jgi:hypothetical protein